MDTFVISMRFQNDLKYEKEKRLSDEQHQEQPPEENNQDHEPRS